MKYLLKSTLLVLWISAVTIPHACQSEVTDVVLSTEPGPVSTGVTEIKENNSSLPTALSVRSTSQSPLSTTQKPRDNDTKGNKTKASAEAESAVNKTVISTLPDSSVDPGTTKTLITALPTTTNTTDTAEVNPSLSPTGTQPPTGGTDSEPTVSSLVKGSTQGNVVSVSTPSVDVSSVETVTTQGTPAGSTGAGDQSSVANIISTQEPTKVDGTSQLPDSSKSATSQVSISNAPTGPTKEEDMSATPPLNSAEPSSEKTMPPATSEPSIDVSASSADQAPTTQKAGPSDFGRSTGLKVAVGVCIPIAVIAIIVGFLLLRKKCKKKGRGYQTLDDFGIGNYEGLNNPNYGADLDL